MGVSLESSRPIMAPSLSSKRASTRMSTYSAATVTSTLSTASAQEEFKNVEASLDKLENKKLVSQRFVPTAEKTDNLKALALGAKLERALGRRLGGQDAVMRVRKPNVVNEKVVVGKVSEESEKVAPIA